MLNDLFGKHFKTAFWVILILECLSFLAFQNQAMMIGCFILISAVFIYLGIKDFRLAFLMLLGELMIGSKGYLFFLPIGGFKISIRIALFTIFLVVYLFKLINHERARWFFKSNWLKYYLLLGLFLIIGTIYGFLNNSLSGWFFDLNAWLYFLIVPAVFYALLGELVVKKTLALFLAATLYLSLKSLFIMLFFVYHPIDTTVVYQWIRNSGVGEITWISGNFWRVFFQSQIYVLFGWLLSLILIALAKPDKKTNLWLHLINFLAGVSLLISLSRSFWLGLMFGLIFVIIFLVKEYFWNWQRISRLMAMLIAAAALEIGFLFLISGFNFNIFAGRLDAGEAAASSRWNQLPVLSQAINQSPLLGYGFGKELTYISNDPRIRVMSVNGEYTTSAFEWGYLDIALKLGYLGLVAYLLILAKITRECLKFGLIGLFFGASISALVFTHIFSPYLNHPLGICLIVLASAFIHNQEQLHGTNA